MKTLIFNLILTNLFLAGIAQAQSGSISGVGYECSFTEIISSTGGYPGSSIEYVSKGHILLPIFGDRNQLILQSSSVLERSYSAELNFSHYGYSPLIIYKIYKSDSPEEVLVQGSKVIFSVKNIESINLKTEGAQNTYELNCNPYLS